jgi:dTDP-4-amino-4,6-dideoxygalactose transaminase
VIIPAFICTVVRHAVKMAGAKPRFVDIDLTDFTYNLSELENAVSDKTKAVVLPHLFGRVARNFEAVMDLCSEKNVLLVEDCAHSLGAEYKGQRIGSFGEFSIFSLTKGMVNCGGGMLVTNSEKIYRSARKILSHETASTTRSIADFPLVLGYGLEQAAEKLSLERVGKRRLGKGLEFCRKCLIKGRQIVIGILKQGKSTDADGGGITSSVREDSEGVEGGYNQGIQMERLVASIGRSQLRKVDEFNRRRKAIAERLCKVEGWYFKTQNGSLYKDVDTFAVLRCSSENTLQMAEEAQQKGLHLKGTWPTHQKLWEGQNTENVRRAASEFLTYNISPDLTSSEVEKIVQIVNGR